VRRAARQSKTVRFTALPHHITTDLLKQSYLALTRDAAPGTDGVTWQAYGENLEEKLKDLPVPYDITTQKKFEDGIKLDSWKGSSRTMILGASKAQSNRDSR
jgi:hypothetical protein